MALARFGQSSLRLHQRFRRAASSRLTVTDPDGTARGVVTAYVTDWPAPQYTPPGGTAIPDTEWTLAATRSTVAADSTRTGLRVGRLVTDGVTTWGVVTLSTALGVAEATLLRLRPLPRATFALGGVAVAGLSDLPCQYAADLDVLIDSQLQIEAVLRFWAPLLPTNGTRPDPRSTVQVTEPSGRVVSYKVLRHALDSTDGVIERTELKRV